MGAKTKHLAGGLLLASTALGALAMPGEEAPPGADGWDALLPAADELMARHDCLACHAPDSTALGPRPASAARDDVAGRLSVPWLVSFLEDRGRCGTHHTSSPTSRREPAAGGRGSRPLPRGHGGRSLRSRPSRRMRRPRARPDALPPADARRHGPLESLDEFEVSSPRSICTSGTNSRTATRSRSGRACSSRG